MRNRTDLHGAWPYGLHCARHEASELLAFADSVNVNHRKKAMSNPWLKKNPFMSMWLSTANSVAGSMRGQATAEAKRQVNAAIAEATRENLKVWNAAVKPAAAKPAARTKRTR